MKILSPDARGQIDGTIHKNIFDHLNHNLPVDIVPISYQPDFAFVLPRISGKWILIDFLEPNSRQYEYDKFWLWAAQNPPALHFKRELLKKDVTDTLKPIEFPCVYEPKRSHDREQFNARKFDVLYFWGMSHVSRPLLQADIWRGMAKDGISVLSHWDQIHGLEQIPADQKGPIWLSIYTPHWTRKTMSEILSIMAQSKVTVAMPGNGEKCFRHAECVDTLMAMLENDRAWSYPWDHTNSIQLGRETAYIDLLSVISMFSEHDTAMYELYSACCDNMANYFAPTYAKNYVQKEIEKCL